ncbi:MAG: SDR family NAD(P)-dependent oxidoreductase, partial [Deltaproteobacteria bacterium]|nr:SDR family NAD(P)-dependent oxidoreductase [Deltaproteobacteria bacterium]
FNLKDKVFVVTGGSRGIGLEITKMLLDQKAKVAICGRKQEGLDAAAAELNAGENLLAVPAHVARSEDVDGLFD